MKKKILVVDDEETIIDLIQFNLKKEGYDVVTARDGEDALKKALEEKMDLVLLDVMLPKIDGFIVCKKIREKSEVPIIMITAKEEESDKVLGLELGADDYIVKPFGVRELLARIKANLRRKTEHTESSKEYIKTFGELTINLTSYEVKNANKAVDLTYREFELLKFLSTYPGQVFSRESLLEKVWGYEYFGDMRTVDVTIRRLREKIETNSAQPDFILTKRSVGYYFKK